MSTMDPSRDVAAAGADPCFALMAEGFPGFCLLVDRGGTVVAANARAREMFGDVTGRPVPFFSAGFPARPVAAPLDVASGSRLYRVVVAGPAGDRRTLVLGLDISDLEVSRRQAARREGQFAAIVESAMEGVAVAVDGRLVYVNPFLERLTGHDAATLCSRPFSDFLHEEDRDGVVETHRKRLAGEPAASGQSFRIRSRDGQVRWVRAVSRRLAWDGESASVSLLADITDERRAQLALDALIREQDARIEHRTASLRRANATLEAANARLSREIEAHERTAKKLAAAQRKATQATKAKSVFLANMSHEIRTPLNVILGMADMLLRPDCRESLDRERALAMIREAGISLRGLLGDLLDLSRGEAGRLALEAVPFRPAEVLGTVLSRHGPQAAEQGLTLAGTLAPDVPEVLRGDPGRLTQVVGNLVANALKFTPAGRVDVAVVRAGPRRGGGDEPGTVRLRFCVRDTGIGIPPEHRQHIFKSFRQVDEAGGALRGGAGLGLAICRRLVTLMGGRIRVSSTPGQGSEFSFTARFGLPGAGDPPAATPPAATGPAAPPPLDILLAEDSNLSAEMVAAFLAPRGHRLTRASNGREALTALAMGHFDVVLMDIRMPVLDGLAATTAIRRGEVPGCDPAIPILALTAHGAQRDRDRILAAGATDYLAKPVGLDALLHALARIAPGREGARAAPARPPAIPEAGAPGAAATEAFDAGRAEALENLGGDVGLYDRLAAVFARDTPGDREKLRRAMEAGDGPGVVLLAHALKGNAGVIGASLAAARARDLELAAREGRATDFPALEAALGDELDRVLAGLAGRGIVPAD